jgi:hypothetical protein
MQQLSPKHEAFCQLAVQASKYGWSQALIYQKAGYRAVGHSAEMAASRLMKKDEIRQRIAELMAPAERKARFSYKKTGDIFAPPQLTYVLAGSPAKVRDTYRNAITQSLQACAPMHFSRGLGSAIAGKPIMIRYVDDRDLTREQ